jgi:hypothetical protein
MKTSGLQSRINQVIASSRDMRAVEKLSFISEAMKDTGLPIVNISLNGRKRRKKQAVEIVDVNPKTIKVKLRDGTIIKRKLKDVG